MLIPDVLQDRLEGIIKPLLEFQNYDLVGIKVFNQKGVPFIEMFIDRPKGGITLEECAKLNRDIAAKIDEQGDLADNYALSVSSPGIDWPLRGKRDFDRVMGRTIRVHLKEEIEGKIEWEGVLADVQDNQILLNSKRKIKGKNKKEERIELVIPLEGIQKAIQQT